MISKIISVKPFVAQDKIINILAFAFKCSICLGTLDAV